jgi:hypothetical protein
MVSIVRTITHWANDGEMQPIKFIAPTWNINHTYYNIFDMYKNYEVWGNASLN